MASQPKKSLDDLEKDAKETLERVKRERKELADAQRSTRAFAVLDAIDKMVEAGDEEAKRVMDRLLDGLTVKRERLAFGLDPLPVPGPAPVPYTAPVDPVAEPAPSAEPAARPSPKERVDALLDRLDRAVKAWTDGTQTEELKAELIAAVLEFETKTGQLYTGMKNRAFFGFGQSPGERL